MPSRETSKKTNTMLIPFASTGKNPTADSNAKATSITDCRMAGSAMSRDGSGGRPIDMEDREKKTVVW